MLQKDKDIFYDLIITKIDTILEEVEKDITGVNDLHDGEETVCLVCDDPVKPCEENPVLRCKQARKGSTEMDELENALLRLENDTFGICQCCNQPIPNSFLLKKPTLIFCESCSIK
jgi:RNA polymerase-binding transcription factor DksA